MEGAILNFILAYIIVVFAIYSLGLLIASIAPSVKVSNLLCTIVYFPMFFLAGATVPYEVMPSGLQKVSDVMPLNHGIRLIEGVTLGGQLEEFSTPIIVLLSIGLLCTIISVRTFKYDYQ